MLVQFTPLGRIIYALLDQSNVMSGCEVIRISEPTCADGDEPVAGDGGGYCPLRSGWMRMQRKTPDF